MNYEADCYYQVVENINSTEIIGSYSMLKPQVKNTGI